LGKKPVFIYDACMACGICVEVCPISILDSTDVTKDKYRKAYPLQKEGTQCIGCKMCKIECPVSAVDVTG